MLCRYPSYWMGRVFIPAEHIVELKAGRFGGYTLRHDSPEIRNPVCFRDAQLFDAIVRITSSRESVTIDGGEAAED